MSQAIDGDHRSHLLAILSRSQSNVPFEKGAKATQAAVANFKADFEHTQAGVRQQLLRSFDTQSCHKSMWRFLKRATKCSLKVPRRKMDMLSRRLQQNGVAVALAQHFASLQQLSVAFVTSKFHIAKA